MVGTGIGTQQTETFLTERFADFPVIRVDSDTMTSRQSMPDLIEQLGVETGTDDRHANVE
ncbi:MAG: hypothetical protein CM15mP103_01120 [Gammaproteobacteria bacterium]|nr:MAG: hypothetical protein CM15mP103_01120 [Gammaproteobacteria bacterium]